MEEEFNQIMSILSEANLINESVGALPAKLPSAKPYYVAPESDLTDTSSSLKRRPRAEPAAEAEGKGPLSEVLFNTASTVAQSERFFDMLENTESAGEAGPEGYPSL
jgi:hypothetical protein